MDGDDFRAGEAIAGNARGAHQARNADAQDNFKLVAGDVIPFQALKQDDIGVEVSANGSKLYNCEFGKSGDRYMVRVKNNVSTDDEILRHLMG